MKININFLFPVFILVSLGLTSCKSALNFPGITLPINNQMIIEVDGVKMISKNISAAIIEKKGLRGLAIRTNFLENNTPIQLNLYFAMKSEELSKKDYRFSDGCQGKSICGFINYNSNMSSPGTDQVFTSELRGGQALFKITDLDLREGGYIEGYFAAALASISVKGKALNNGRFRVNISESLNN